MVPADDDHAETDTEPGLVRAADLIGQLADPLYPSRLNALYHEFVETGVAERLGCASPADLAERYPRFFWDCVEPYIGDALTHLGRTVADKQWIAKPTCSSRSNFAPATAPSASRPPRPAPAAGDRPSW